MNNNSLATVQKPKDKQLYIGSNPRAKFLNYTGEECCKVLNYKTTRKDVVAYAKIQGFTLTLEDVKDVVYKARAYKAREGKKKKKEKQERVGSLKKARFLNMTGNQVLDEIGGLGYSQIRDYAKGREFELTEKEVRLLSQRARNAKSRRGQEKEAKEEVSIVKEKVLESPAKPEASNGHQVSLAGCTSDGVGWNIELQLPVGKKITIHGNGIEW